MTKASVKAPSLNEFIIKNLYVVDQEAKTFVRGRSLPHYMDFEELKAIGNEAYVKAVQNVDFKCSEGEIFSFIRMRVKGSFIDYMRNYSDTTRGVHRFMKDVDAATKDFEAKHKVMPSEAQVAKKMGIKLEKLQKMKNKKYNTSETVYLDHKVGDSDDDKTVKDYLASDAPTALELMEKEEIKGSIRQCFQSLSAEELFLVNLFYGEDYRLKDIAKLYFVSEQAVHIKLKKIYERMKDFLQKEIRE